MFYEHVPRSHPSLSHHLTPTRCSGCRGSFPSRAPKEGSQIGAVTTLCTWRRSCSCCRAAQQEKPAELAGREPSAGGGSYGGLARLGAARAHREAARGAANVLLGSYSTFTTEPLVGRAVQYGMSRVLTQTSERGQRSELNQEWTVLAEKLESLTYVLRLSCSLVSSCGCAHAQHIQVQ